MDKLKVIFMGTPTFAVGMLDTLVEMGVNVVAVVSQPDKPVGRKKILQATPVKNRAIEYKIDVIQPINISKEYQDILNYEPDLIITCAYGQIVPKALLEAPNYGCLNIHASLLPKYRGGAPIHMAVIQGEKETGITLMKMVEKMDAGAILVQKKVDIDIKDTTADLYNKLEVAGKELLKESLKDYIQGKLKEVEQDTEKVTYAWNISKEQEFISFHRPVEKVYNHIRGLISWPVGYGIIKEKKIKFHQAFYIEQDHNDAFGKLIGLQSDKLKIAAQGGYILIETLQLEGKSKVSAKEFYNGIGKAWIGECFQ